MVEYQEILQVVICEQVWVGKGEYMPTNRVKNKTEAEKEPTGQELLERLLDPIQHNAVKTIQKVQKEQITAAMQQGVPAEHILQQLGINPKLPVNQEIVDDPGKALGKINPSKVEDNNINSMTVPGGYSKKPASSPFGFGGASMQNGQIVVFSLPIGYSFAYLL